MLQKGPVVLRGFGENGLAAGLQKRRWTRSRQRPVPSLQQLIFMKPSDTPNLDQDLNRETISSDPDANPLATGLGAAGGAVAGAALGSAGGPVGTFIGGAVGALAGGLAGSSISEDIDPETEDEFWEENYRNEPYYDDVYTYQDYGPAYRAGYSARAAGESRTFEEAEPGLRRAWENSDDQSGLTWDRAKDASRAAWDRVERARPGEEGGRE